MTDIVKDIISKQLGADISQINEDTKIAEDLGADSLDIIEMIVEIEAECGVNIPDEVVPTLQTVGDVLNYIEANKK